MFDGVIYYFFFKVLDCDKVKEEKIFVVKEVVGEMVEV